MREEFQRVRQAGWRAGIAAICALAWILIPASGAGQEAADEGINFTDQRGQRYENARLLRVEAGSIIIMTSSGVSRLPVGAVSAEVRSKLGVTDSMLTEGDVRHDASPAPPAGPPAPAPAASVDDIELAKVRGSMAKISSELAGLEESRRILGDDYNKEFATAKTRLDSRYEIELQEYDKRMRHRRNPGNPPERLGPDQDPQVQRIKERLDRYDEQIKDRKEALLGLGRTEREITDRMTAARRAAEREADRQQMAERVEDAKRRAEQERKEHQERYAAQRRMFEEKEAREKEEAGKAVREVKERVSRTLAECREMVARDEPADIRAAFLKLQALYADRGGWAFPGGGIPEEVAAVAVDLFARARASNQLAVATASLKIAVELDGQGEKLSGEILRFFDEAAALVKEGDFSGLTHHMEFMRGIGIDNTILVRRKEHELSDLAADRGWDALRGLDLLEVGPAFEAARRLWDQNPRLGWLRTMMGGSFFVGILVGLLIIFKGVEKLYWWLNRG